MDDSKIFSRGVSPIASPLQIPQEPPGHIRSLGSELGTEYWNNQEGSTSDHRHVRTTSLFSLSPLVDNTPSNRTIHSPSASLIESSPVPPSKGPAASSFQRSRSMRDKDRSSDTGTLDRSRSQLRSRLLSQTISARSTRWSDGRLEDIAISTPRISGPLITEMFQKAVQQVTGSSPVAAVTSPRTSHVAEVNLNESRERSPDRPVVEPTDEACT